MVQSADFVIIGAGCVGIHLAYQLARRKAGRVVVVEKDAIACGTTGRSSAVLRHHYTNPEVARLAARGVDAYRHFHDLFGGPAGYTEVGYLILVGPDDADALRFNVDLLRGLGVDTTVITPREIGLQWPHIYTGDVALAAWEPHAGFADPVISTQTAADAARRAGVTIRQNAEVVEILLSESGRVQGVEIANGDRIVAPVVVDCAGPWAARVARLAGTELPVSPVREQIAVFDRPAHVPTHPVVSDLIRLAYFRPEGQGLTLAGNSDHRDHAPEPDPDVYEGRVDEDFVVAAVEKLSHRFPPMGDAGVRRGYTGLYEVTPDYNPIMDQVPGVEGFYCSVGFSGHGFKLAPAAGELVADLILTGGSTVANVRTFRATRFEEGEPIRGVRPYKTASVLR